MTKEKAAQPLKAKAFSPSQITRNVLVIAPSGRGKSHAIKNLNPKTTLIINVEGKPLPFKNAAKFKKHLVLDQESPLEIFKILKIFSKDKDVETIVIDSFSEWSDHLIRYCKKTYADREFPYGKYSEFVEKLFRSIKAISGQERPLNIILTAHDDVIEDKEGNTIKTTKVKGKELRGQVERHFTIVLFGVAKFDEEDRNHYYFQVQSDGIVPAKSPEGMFKDQLIDNDYLQVIEAMNEYWN